MSSSSSSLLSSYDEILSRYEKVGQGHVLDHYNELSSDEEKNELLQQLNNIQVEKIRPLFEAAVTAAAVTTTMDDDDDEDKNNEIQPFEGNCFAMNDNNESNTSSSIICKYRSIGMNAIHDGKVAALVLAGGQGTRLGYDGPKGMYTLDQLPSQKTLFQLISERVLKLCMLSAEAEAERDDQEEEEEPPATTMTNGCDNIDKKAGVKITIPFYIMTSPINHLETVQFFDKNDYFGLGIDNVYFFQQGMLPCLTKDDGKIIMETANKVAMAPDGNGGIYPSLASSGALDDMKNRRQGGGGPIEYLHVFSIDNALVKPVDPIFIGYCISMNADCGNKVVWKTNPHEKVGVLASRRQPRRRTTTTSTSTSDGTNTSTSSSPLCPCIVEYSEISNEMAERIDPNTGRLVFGAANICNHFYTIDFIQNTILPNMNHVYHIAYKKIPYYDPDRKTTIIPTQQQTNNGIKLETFIFDVFPYSERMAIMDVPRKEEFSPIKNKTGMDSPQTAISMISTLSKEWIERAGGKVVVVVGADAKKNNNHNNNDDENENDDGICCCEVSPLTSYAGEGLEAIVKDKEFVCPFSI